ncbi:MAG: hypothetical protein QOH32_4406 [Bradyrhizobium sp.]|jgi:hypothetical protein|nr:hypothetical protein [Bradyrhizobium sp.]
MKRPKFRAAWRALWNKQQPQLGDRVELYTDTRTAFGTILVRALFVLLIGGLIIAVALAWESLEWQAGGVPPSHHPESLAAELSTAHLWRHVVYDIGFAFLIASLVSTFIEYSSIREQDGMLKKAIGAIGESVILGVYKIRHPEEYIKAVVNSCLAIRHIRRDYNVICEVYDLTDAECEELGVIPRTLVKVVADVKYKSNNMGHDYAFFEGRYYIPKRGGKLETLAKVTYLKVGEKTYTEDEIEVAEIKPGEENYSSSDRSYKFPLYAYPDDPIPIHIKSVFVKERSDNEIFVFLYPSIAASIKFFFHVEGLRIGVKSRTASDSTDAATVTDGHVEWKVTGPLLPYNYVTVWWRSAADDGEPEMDPSSAQAPLALPRPAGVPSQDTAQSGTSSQAEGLQPTRNSVTALFKWLNPSSWRRG